MQYNPDTHLGRHAMQTYKVFYSALEKILKPTGVSAAQHIVLIHLINEGAMPQIELADRLSIAPASAVKLIDRMERDGWVTRQESIADRRIKLVVSTEQSTQIWKKASALGLSVLEKAYRGIAPEDIEMVKRVLEQVRGNLLKG